MRTRFKIILVIFLCIGIYMFNEWNTSSGKINSDKNIGKFLNGAVCYFATDGYGNVFKNPYDPAGGSQVVYNKVNTDLEKGQINIVLVAAAGTRAGITSVAADVTAATATKGKFLVTYATADDTEGTTGDEKGKEFELK